LPLAAAPPVFSPKSIGRVLLAADQLSKVLGST
jgi:hypothetical protein